MKQKITYDYFEDFDGDILDVTLPIKSFEVILQNGIEQNIDFFEQLHDELENYKQKNRVEYGKKELN